LRIPGPEPSSTPCDECGPRSFHRLLPDRQSSDGWELTTRFTCLQPAAGKVDQFAPRDRSCRQHRTTASSRTVSKRASRCRRAAGNCHRFASMNLIDGTTRQTSALMPSALAMWRAFAAERPARRSGDRPKHKPRRFGSSDSGCFSERCSEQVIVSCQHDLHSAKHPSSVIARLTNGGIPQERLVCKTTRSCRA
jgi:hypothetical protein